MSTGTITGTNRTTLQEEVSIEWKIDNFKIDNFFPPSGYSDKHLVCPNFTFKNATWYLHLKTFDGSKEWISLYLRSKKCNPAQIVSFESVVRRDGVTLGLQHTFVRKFRGDAQHGIQCFLRKSDLVFRKDKIAPLFTNNSLVIICKLRNALSPVGNRNRVAPGVMDIFVSKHLSDFRISVKGEMFPAHKVILAASSKVFSAMFEHEMSETHSGVLYIEDCEPEFFKAFLEFLYVGSTNITDCNVYPLYAIAHKYCVEALTTSCVTYMISNMSANNICDVAILGKKFSDKDINVACSEFFEQNIREVLVTKEWISLMEDDYKLAHELLMYIAPRITVEKSTQDQLKVPEQTPIADPDMWAYVTPEY